MAKKFKGIVEKLEDKATLLPDFSGVCRDVDLLKEMTTSLEHQEEMRCWQERQNCFSSSALETLPPWIFR